MVRISSLFYPILLAPEKIAYDVELQRKLELEAQEDQYMVMVYPTSGLEED